MNTADGSLGRTGCITPASRVATVASNPACLPAGKSSSNLDECLKKKYQFPINKIKGRRHTDKTRADFIQRFSLVVGEPGMSQDLGMGENAGWHIFVDWIICADDNLDPKDILSKGDTAYVTGRSWRECIDNAIGAFKAFQKNGFKPVEKIFLKTNAPKKRDAAHYKKISEKGVTARKQKGKR